MNVNSYTYRPPSYATDEPADLDDPHSSSRIARSGWRRRYPYPTRGRRSRRRPSSSRGPLRALAVVGFILLFFRPLMFMAFTALMIWGGINVMRLAIGSSRERLEHEPVEPAPHALAWEDLERDEMRRHSQELSDFDRRLLAELKRDQLVPAEQVAH